MPTIRRVLTVDKPISQVFAFLSDFTTTEEWDPGTVSTRLASGDGGVGTAYENVSSFLGRKTALTYVVQAHVAPTRFALRGENKTLVAHDTLELRDLGGRTEVTYTAQFDFKGKSRFAEPLLRLPLKKLGDDGRRGMLEALQKL